MKMLSSYRHVTASRLSVSTETMKNHIDYEQLFWADHAKVMDPEQLTNS